MIWLSVAHVETPCIFQLSKQKHLQLPVCVCWEKWLFRGRRRESESFKYSISDIGHLCKLPWRFKIVPVINSFEPWMMKSTGWLEGQKLQALVLWPHPCSLFLQTFNKVLLEFLLELSRSYNGFSAKDNKLRLFWNCSLQRRAKTYSGVLCFAAQLSW